jgi:hypothetical protein
MGEVVCWSGSVVEVSEVLELVRSVRGVRKYAIFIAGRELGERVMKTRWGTEGSASCLTI